MTPAERAFSALDQDKDGVITNKELKKLSSKLGKDELNNLMAKVKRTELKYKGIRHEELLQLDLDGDGRLTLDEFQVLFSKRTEEDLQRTPQNPATPLPSSARSKLFIKTCHHIFPLLFFVSVVVVFYLILTKMLQK